MNVADSQRVDVGLKRLGLDEEKNICKFHGCSFRNKNPRKLKIHEKTQCPSRNLSLNDYWDAAVNGDINIIKNMIEYGRDKNPADKDGVTALHYALSVGQLEVVQLILQHVEDKNPAAKDGYTALHCAAETGNLEIVQFFMRNVEDKNPAAKDGRTPLHAAAVSGNVEVVQKILDCVNDRHPKDADGETPLQYAIE